MQDCSKRTLYRSFIVGRQGFGPELRFYHYLLLTLIICLTPINLSFTIYQMGMKIPTKIIPEGCWLEGRDVTHPLWEWGKSLIWKALLLEMRKSHIAEMHEKKGHSCLKYICTKEDFPQTVVRNLAVPAPPPFQTWARVSLQEETTLTVYELPFKGKLICLKA